MKVEGSVALVTGANGGIGSALVNSLLDRRAAKIYAAARDVGAAISAFQDPRVVRLALDVTNPDQVAAAAQVASDVTIIFNNAGVSGFSGALSAKGLGIARHEMEVNYFGPLALVQAFRDAPALQEGGAVVNVLSILSLVTIPAAGTYSASKAAALALTRTLRAELKGRGVQVLGAMPVQTETALGQSFPEPRLQPAEVAKGILDALEAGEDEVFPGNASAGAAAAFAADPAGLQERFAAFVHAI